MWSPYTATHRLSRQRDATQGVPYRPLRHPSGATFSSGNRNPFVCFADISPRRGITFQGEEKLPHNKKGRIISAPTFYIHSAFRIRLGPLALGPKHLIWRVPVHLHPKRFPQFRIPHSEFRIKFQTHYNTALLPRVLFRPCTA